MSESSSVGRRHGWRLSIVVLAMFGFGFALGPIYNAVCKATGINGKFSGQVTDVSKVEAVDTSRTVKVLFVTTVNGGRPWHFRPEQASVEVHPGQLTTVKFVATNTEGRELIAQAVPNIAPWDAARHLKKTECFCFSKQTFQAGETKEMPVRFVLDRELPPDVDTVTLSYTFFDVTEAAHHDAAVSNKNQG